MRVRGGREFSSTLVRARSEASIASEAPRVGTCEFDLGREWGKKVGEVINDNGQQVQVGWRGMRS
jgi:hypothetical protein